jgi:hypothetical protein
MKRQVATLTFGILGLFLLALAAPVSAQQSGAETPELELPWPFDFEVKQGTYSRDIIFNTKAAEEYLANARALYMKGYDLIKKYQGVKDNPNPYVRDPYKVFVHEMRSLSFRNDFSTARSYFLLSYNVFTEGMQWDTGLRQKPEYKDLLRKVLKGLIQTSIYMKELFTANDYLDTYVSLYPEDKGFTTEYRVKIVSMLVDQQDDLSIMYFGEKSGDAPRLKYQTLVQQYVDARPDLDPKTRAWIIDRAAPKWSTKDFNLKTIDTNYGK